VTAPAEYESEVRAPAPHRVVLVGNPNVGKTSLFNHLTGLRARVGNYPGVTVERRVGRIRHGSAGARPIELADAPGTYSLSARSEEEQITFWEVVGRTEKDRPDALVVVLDAGQLARCLYLLVQLLELRLPLVVALNMADETDAPGDLKTRLAERLGVPVVTTNGRTGAGIEGLVRAVEDVLGASKSPVPRFHVTYAAALRSQADRVQDELPAGWKGNVERSRALAFWALASIEADDELLGIPDALRQRVAEVRESQDDIDLGLASARYAAIDELLEDIGDRPPVARILATERVDRILLHPLWGFLVFALTMGAVFQALFAGADPAISAIEWVVSSLQGIVADVLSAGILRDLISEGILGGVGNVIVFLPQILLLFLFIGLLEDSGYMARVAYLVDRVMRSLGLHGRAFVPMLSGFACAVPAILATRTLERRRDRILTMMVVPLMTCSARLPVYSLIIAAIFPVEASTLFPVQGLLLLAMYLLSVVTSLLAAWVLGRTLVRGRSVPLLLELPPYRAPRLAPTLLMMKGRAVEFLREAGSVILVATVLLWGLLYFPRPAADASPGAHVSAEVTPLEQSYGGRLGKLLEPVVRPLGFDWKIATGIIGAFAAREVFVSTMALVYQVDGDDEHVEPLRDRIRAEKKADGSPTFTPAVGLSLMVFFAFACQCMSTLAVVRRETQSWRWPALLFAYMTTLAYVASLFVFQVGRALGF
jgi:ferrous iron transport protein B